MHHPFESLDSRRALGARRILVLLGSIGLALGLAGCFNAEAEPGNEAIAVAEALTRSVSFIGGSLEDGPLPPAEDESLSLVPLESSVLLTPGSASLMSLMPDNPDPDDPVEAVLVQFGVARKHIEVSLGKVEAGGDIVGSDQGGSPVSLGFDVASDVCETLCNKRFSVEVKQQLRTKNGKKGRAVSRMVQLECSSHGSSKYCANDGRTVTAGNSGDLEKRVIDNLERCDLLASSGSLSVGRLPCLWDCLADLDCQTLRDGLCGGAQDITSSCASACTDEALAEFRCDDGGTVSALFECDGEEDCGDGSDEFACDTFTCDGVSFPDYYRCDLSNDCSDGSDEIGCAELSCGGAIDPSEGGFGGAAGGAGSMTAGSGGGFSGAGGRSGADAGPAAGSGGFAGSSGGAGGVGGAPEADAGISALPGQYGAFCIDDADCSAASPHCVPTPSGNACSIDCTGQCPPMPGSGFIPLCIGGICTGG